jgi:hypothetical protein
VEAIFSFYNAFQAIQTVQWANANQLLFISASKVAKLIQQRGTICLWIIFMAKFWHKKAKEIFVKFALR